MRPVIRGAAPPEAPGWTNFRSAFPHLRQAMGPYCSYCERKIATNLAVEHMQPKDLYPALEREWDNFLLGCTNCNSTKGDKDVGLDDVLWPHRDNTMRAFVYLPDGQVEVNPALPPAERDQAQATLELTGLDRHPNNPDSPAPTTADDRHLSRDHAMRVAEDLLEDWRFIVANVPPARVQRMLATYMELVAADGFWAVWYTVFSGEPEFLEALVGWTGTDPASFDAGTGYQPQPRPGGYL